MVPPSSCTERARDSRVELKDPPISALLIDYGFKGRRSLGYNIVAHPTKVMENQKKRKGTVFPWICTKKAGLINAA